MRDYNRPLMNFILSNSQYKHECDIEQQREKEDAQHNSSMKSSDRHSDNSLLGSVRRRLIAPKLRIQNSTNHDNAKSSLVSTVIPTTSGLSSTHDSRSRTLSVAMDLRRSASRESITINGDHTGRVNSFFSSSKVIFVILLLVINMHRTKKNTNEN